MSEYYDLPVCDLRHIASVEEAKSIKSIYDVAMLILPKNADPEVMSAIAAIEKYDIANIVYLDPNAKVSIINGLSSINKSSAPADTETCYIVNGVALVEDLPENGKINLTVNGAVFIKKFLEGNAALTLDAINGTVQYIDFDDFKMFQNELELDLESISYLNENTLLVVGNKLTVADDVTVDALREKKLQLFVGNELHAPKHLLAYLRMNAFVGNQIIEK